MASSRKASVRRPPFGTFKYPSDDECPDAHLHTPQPYGYVARAEWADRMLKTHKQERCPTCNYWAIWTPKPDPRLDRPPDATRQGK